MKFFKRRETIEEIFERLRLASCECSGLGLEEEDEGQVDQAHATAKGEVMSKGNGVAKEFCGKCHLTFGLAEKRVAVDRTTVMHEDCYEKHLHEISLRADRLHNFVRNFSRIVH